MARPDSMPEVVFIGPPKSRAKFNHVVFRVLGRDGDGIPTELRLMRQDETVNLSGGEEFMTGYIPAQMTRPYKKGTGA